MYERKKQYRKKLQIHQRMPQNADDFNAILLKTIILLEDKASFTQIKKSFERQRIPKLSRTGERLDLKYLEVLIKRSYINKDENNIFYVDVEGEEFLKERNEKRKQAELKEKQKEYERKVAEMKKDAMDFKPCETCGALNPIKEQWCFECGEKL